MSPRDPTLTSAGLVGNAGEFFVLAELTRRGWTAALTARNNHAWDILATKNDAFVKLRVKTKTTITDVFQWNAKKSGAIFLEISTCNDFCVLVDIPLDDSGPTYYIVPTATIDNWLKTDFQIWVSAPGARGQQRADNTRRMIYANNTKDGYLEELQPFKNAWRTLEAAASRAVGAGSAS